MIILLIKIILRVYGVYLGEQKACVCAPLITQNPNQAKEPNIMCKCMYSYEASYPVSAPAWW